MKNTIFKITFFSLIFLVSNSCIDVLKGIEVEGAIVTKTLELDPIKKVYLNMAAKVDLVQGPKQEVVVTAQEGIFDLLNTNLTGDQWQIELQEGSYSFERVSIRITVPDIEEVYIDASGDVSTPEGFTNQEEVKFVIDGSGDIDFKTDAQTVKVNIDASGDIVLNGATGYLDVKIGSSGSFSGFGLQTQTAKVDINASGDAEVFVQESLDISINGNGDVFYKGNPTLETDINGNGDIINAN